MSASLPVLAFHSIDDQPLVTSFSPEVFVRGLARLYERGYQALDLLAAADHVRHGTPFPDRSMVITFDDGYRSVYEQAFPVLQRHGLSATVFLTVGEEGRTRPGDQLPSLNGYPMLTWGRIVEMHRHGIAFGAHTLTHPDMTRLPVDRMQREVSRSKAVIEEALGAPVSCFAYPYGRYDERSRDLVRRHFTCACSDRLGLITVKSDPYALERVDAYYLRSERRFALMPTGWFPWYVRARSIPRRVRRAVRPRKNL